MKVKDLIKAIIIPLGLGFLTSLLIKTNLYDNIIKPTLSPAKIVFPIVWTILYILLGVSNYLINKNGKISQKTVSSKITMKKLTPEEIKSYVQSADWHGVCGYRIDGCIAAYVSHILGSYSGIIGLPLYETLNLLKGENI